MKPQIMYALYPRPKMGVPGIPLGIFASRWKAIEASERLWNGYALKGENVKRVYVQLTNDNAYLIMNHHYKMIKE